ncbi:hypothetical protein GCM10010156_24120 [Planobispora rosea]|uniref:Uncharacterized protein n=1 Tax=Planobispora rosea TaxID=35762 RepID=A0A8J3S262_PLARO|nr:hypothetical protein GCM10010156_24120 [Planobispora rosea]GIH84576.1 hypothetical protein Pro02_29840 [Planobispora rosea]
MADASGHHRIGPGFIRAETLRPGAPAAMRTRPAHMSPESQATPSLSRSVYQWYSAWVPLWYGP